MLAFTLLLAAPPAEELTFAPDRPGFADSTDTVPGGHAQIELGMKSSFEDDGTLLTMPSILLRVGLVDWLEARATAPDVQVALPKEGETTTAAADMSLGLKAAFTLGEIFSASVVPFLSVPTGSKALSSGRVDLGIGVNYEFGIGDLAIGGNGIFAFTSDYEIGAGISLGYQFTDSFGAFIETYIQYTQGSTVQPSVAGGLTYLVTPTFQLDLSGGAGVTAEAEGPYVLAGIAALL